MIKMKSYRKWDYIFLIVLLLCCLLKVSQAEYETQKHRRGGGSAGLIPFARVGRSDPNLGNEFHDETEVENNIYPAYFEEYEDLMKNENKRFINTPRIGRNDPSQQKSQRSDRNSLSMFHGPRIGRVDPQLRDLTRLFVIQRALEKRTGPSATSGMWFGPRLGKRSLSEASTFASPTKGQLEEY